ncbi:hypothetical protein ACFWWT_41500 [Streptomyces sp. NPDC058676]|uniref:hypothetical protein n=1 Tax=unclassified Streptomyces TaxID=2593676 RepID=UPI0036496082
MVTLLQDRQTPVPLDCVPTPVRAAGRMPQPTPMFDTCWRYVSTRQTVISDRVYVIAGEGGADSAASAAVS